MFLLIFYIGQNSGALAQSSISIFTEHFPPYNFMENGKVVGINIEIVKRACEISDIECKFALYPWNRSYRYAQETPSSGVMSTARTPQRIGLFNWVGPLVSGHSCIYKLASRTDIIIDKNQSVQQYILGGSRDDAYQHIYKSLGFYKYKNLILYLGKYGQMKPLKLGRIDLVFGSANSIKDMAQHVGLSVSDLMPIAIIERKKLSGNFLALNLDVPMTIVNRLQSAVNLMKENGDFNKIKNDNLHIAEKSIPENVAPDIWRTCMGNAN
jgi:polar amino acid transport system substrate-binding protein